MNIMNLIHEICLTKNRINNIPKYRFITKKMQEKILYDDMLKFLNLDVFDVGDNTLSFLISLDNEMVKNIDSKYFISFSESYISIDVLDNENVSTSVCYCPRLNHFDIWNGDVSYTIYRNSKVGNRINKMWEPLKEKIKEAYLDIILQIAERLY